MINGVVGVSWVFAALLAVGSSPPPSASAQTPTSDEAQPATPVFDGVFRFVGGNAQRDAVTEAVERAVQALLPVFHELARKRLGTANTVPPKVSMSMDGDDLVIVYGDLDPMRAPLDGSVRSWHNREGTKCKLTHERRGDQIVQTSWSISGRRVMVWSLAEDGKALRLHSTMTSMHLPVAIDYRLSFRK
ncbi:MAG: hypothetical protein K0V04_24480 [Deltaproteobacteria bacterium]|nr:hypothetical protein [Deltaproteobacteria bacterium]